MLNHTMKKFREEIPHVMESRPYAFHYTKASNEEEIILYQHWHNEMELFYLEQGEAEIIIEGHSFFLKEGEAAFIPSRMLHMAKRTIQGICSFYAFVFHISLLTDSGPGYSRYHYPLDVDAIPYIKVFTQKVPWESYIISLLKNLFQKMDQTISSWELQLHGNFLLIWQELFHQHISKINLSGNHKQLSNRLSESLHWINQNYAQEISLKELAALSHLSEGAFCRMFKKYTGFTPFQYLNRRRIMKSCELLIQSDMQITEAAMLSGFNNISHFNREFLKYIKTTPNQYRKIQRE